MLLIDRVTLPSALLATPPGSLVIAQPTPRWALEENDGGGILLLVQMLQNVQAGLGKRFPL